MQALRRPSVLVDENTGNVVEDVQQDEEYADMNFDQY